VHAIILGLLDGLSFAGILFMLASGLSLVMGTMGTLNMAHGALYMVGAYVGWSVAVEHHAGIIAGALAAGACAGAVGLVMELGFFRRLAGRPDDQIIMSFGFVYILTSLVQIIWGTAGKPPFVLPPFTSQIQIGDITYPTARLVVTAVAVVVALALAALQGCTRLGSVVRAAMDDAETARSLGLRIELAFVAVFVAGSFVAGLGGLLGGAILGASTSLAIDVLVLSLVVVIVGGVGSIAGSLLASVVIGLAISFGTQLSFGSFAIYVAMIVVLLIRPFGLLGRQFRQA